MYSIWVSVMLIYILTNLCDCKDEVEAGGDPMHINFISAVLCSTQYDQMVEGNSLARQTNSI